MKKIFLIILINLLLLNVSAAKNIKEAYFAGGCFWCMEEFFEKVKGVEEVISGYSGGDTANPTYKEVTYGNTGHFEAAKIIYDENVISYKKLLNLYWQNIDPFDKAGQFCDKGSSYRSVAFYKNEIEKDEIEPGTIVQEILPGYTLHDRLLRPAMVGVSKNIQENQDNKDKENEETE